MLSPTRSLLCSRLAACFDEEAGRLAGCERQEVVDAIVAQLPLPTGEESKMVQQYEDKLQACKEEVRVPESTAMLFMLHRASIGPIVPSAQRVRWALWTPYAAGGYAPARTT